MVTSSSPAEESVRTVRPAARLSRISAIRSKSSVTSCFEVDWKRARLPIQPMNSSSSLGTLRSRKTRSSASVLANGFPVTGSVPFSRSWRNSATSWSAWSAAADSSRADSRA